MKVITYFKKYTGKSKSIVDALKAIGASSSMENRKKIATLNNIKNYTGKASQNTKMLNLLKKGKLIKKVTIKEVKTDCQKFVSYLNDMDTTYHTYGSQIHYSYDDAPKTYDDAKKRLKAGKNIGTTCVVPIKWALKKLGINPDGFYGKNGKFVGFDADMKKKLSKISGKGYTVKQAVDKKHLKAGDICCFKGRTHTFAYTGKGYTCFDGGHAVMKNGIFTGIVANYNTNYYNTLEIAYILRWR